MLRPTCWTEDAVKKKAIRTWSVLISCSVPEDWKQLRRTRIRWSYGTWQIYSPGYNDIVQKGLHFYAPGGVELSIRPDHKDGITFTNAIPNERSSLKVTKAIILAKECFENDMNFRNDILNKANEGVRSVLAHAKTQQTDLRNLANGRSRELRDIGRNVQRYNAKIGCS